MLIVLRQTIKFCLRIDVCITVERWWLFEQCSKKGGSRLSFLNGQTVIMDKTLDTIC